VSYQFARINLEHTDYGHSVSWDYLQPTTAVINSLQQIYRQYCIYKKFTSVMPLFDSRFQDPQTDIIGYYDNQDLVAFSLIKRYDQYNALCDQFAWTYHKPKQRLGIESLKTECAIYKDRNFKYLYLDQAHMYKSQIKGFEILGPMT
jgi:hypothetical protein